LLSAKSKDFRLLSFCLYNCKISYFGAFNVGAGAARAYCYSQTGQKGQEEEEEKEEEERYLYICYCTHCVCMKLIGCVVFVWNIVADLGFFIPDPAPTIFAFRIPFPDPKICSSRILHEKWIAKLPFFLASYVFRSKVMVIVKKRSGIRKKIHPGSSG
jgi:hypothetical protein